ncbi:MAG: hypothetical protein R2792_00800 [Saprospiraceae bacterium]
MDTLLEILKYTIPSVIVFITAYFMIKMHLDEQQRIFARAKKTEAMKISLPIRLQAYERLTLVCDRASIPNTLLRVRGGGMRIADLKGALMLAVSQEFDHNSSQQLYVSETLWQIILLAKANTLKLITDAAEGLDPNAPDDAYVDRLFELLNAQEGANALQTALVAIRTEASQIF